MDFLPCQSLPQQERHKVRNILVRYCGNKAIKIYRLVDKNDPCSETAYLVKYFPKYYKSLTLVLKPQNFLLSKIKKIKKLKKFTGNLNDENWTPQVNWFKILGSNRKEIEEFPEIIFLQTRRFFWKEAALHVAKYFFQITKIQLTDSYCWELTFWKIFAKHLKNMRRLKVLELDMHTDDELKFFFKRLNGMVRLLGKLEVFKFPLRSDVSSDILQTKNILPHLTNLNYVFIFSELSQISHTIPQICKNLKSFSLKFGRNSSEDLDADLPRILDLLTLIQGFSKLQHISIELSEHCPHELWLYFIPPASLRRLKLKFKARHLIAFKSLTKQENLFNHWKEIKELDALNFLIDCGNGGEMLFIKDFVTSMLKKILKLTSFKFQVLHYGGIWKYEPFFVEELSHLYEHLKKFKVILLFWGSVSFDLSFLNPFKNLKYIGYQGHSCSWANIGDAVRLLEGNTKSGGFPTLKLKGIKVYDREELKNLLRQISKAKKNESNLKIELGFEFFMKGVKIDEVEYLDWFCEVIESEKAKGLEIMLEIENEEFSDYDTDDVKRVLDKYPRIRNFVLKITSEYRRLKYFKRDGEKEQLLEC